MASRLTMAPSLQYRLELASHGAVGGRLEFIGIQAVALKVFLRGFSA